MPLKILALLHLFWYSFLLYWGFDDLSTQLDLQQLFLQNNNSGQPRQFLENTEGVYFLTWAVSAILSTLLIFFVAPKRKKWVRIALVCSGSLALLFLYLYLYHEHYNNNTLDWERKIDNLREKQVWWLLGSVVQIFIAGVLLLEQQLVHYKKLPFKYVSLLQGILYLVVLGLGFYYWDQEMLLQALYNSDPTNHAHNLDIPRAINLPNRIYYSILIFLSFCSLISTFLVSKGKMPLLIFRAVTFLFFVYSTISLDEAIFYTLDDGAAWWISACLLLSGLSFLSFWNNKAKLPEQDYADNLLDDLSTLD